MHRQSRVAQLKCTLQRRVSYVQVHELVDEIVAYFRTFLALNDFQEFKGFSLKDVQDTF